MTLSLGARNRLKTALCDAGAGDEICNEIDAPGSDAGNTVYTGTGNFVMAANQKVAVVKKASGAATQVTLPPNPTAWQQAIIIDGKGDAATNNITVVPATGTIDGGASVLIQSNYGDLQLIYSGSEWNCYGNNNTSAAGNLNVPGTLTSQGNLTAKGTSNLTAGTTTLGVVASTPGTVQDVATGNTITLPANSSTKRVTATAGAATGAILTAGAVDGQELTLVNVHATNSITFAIAGTSHVADGTSSALAALTAMTLVWDATSSLWYHQK